MMIGLS